MPHNCERCPEINHVLGRATEALDHERASYASDREALALMVIEMERLAQSMATVTERAKSRIVGFTRSGHPVDGGESGLEPT